MLTIAVVNLKGGTSKTTSAAFLAHVFHERGQRVLLVDADPQGSAARWQEDADWPVRVIRLDTPKLDLRLPGIVGADYDVVVIDTPPHDEGIVSAAVRVASHVVIPMAPTPAEHERLDVVRALLANAAAFRGDHGPVVAVLLTRAVAGAASTRVYRELIEEDGVTVLRTQVRNLQRFALALGSPVKRAGASAYGDAVDELAGMVPGGAQQTQETTR